jgi:hypothetical protein
MKPLLPRCKPDLSGFGLGRPNYPLVAVVHGNGHDYDFLLQHLARNGFIAASIDLRFLSGTTPIHGMNGLGRANVFFQHMAVLQARFGAKVTPNRRIKSAGEERKNHMNPLIQVDNPAILHRPCACLSLSPTLDRIPLFLSA